MKRAFLLLGAQRSGTSVTSHLLSKFDICFGNPSHFLQADHNPIFFELTWINQFNDRLIRSLGYTYTDLFLPIEADYDRPCILEFEQELSTLIQQEWSDEPSIGIKDPRCSLTFPVWQRVLQAQGYQLNIIVVYRHPASFLRSNQQLFYNWAGWDQTRHLHFWLRLTLAALYFSRNYLVMPVNYEALMEHPLKTAERLAHCFHLNPRQIEAAAAVVDPTHQHHRQFVLTGDTEIDRYYSLLQANQLSEADYLNYRNMVLDQMVLDQVEQDSFQGLEHRSV
jgi:hypothetical protein